jgi:NAD(P)-dependent dehydrogenase (short-subunit alcohol dehydrogenase family)
MSQSKKVAFITGANRGLGLETARELAEKGVHVIIGSRTKAGGEEALKVLASKGLKANFVVFDVNNNDDHQYIYDHIQNQFGKLDILVNNAGIWIDPTSVGNGSNNTSTVSPKTIKETFDTNFFSVVTLTQTLLPLIRKSDAGRIVNLSSILGSLNLHSEKSSPIYNMKAFAYNASKVALNAFTVHLAHELKDTPIKVNSAHPGWVKTELGGVHAPMEVSEGGKTSAELALLDDHGPTGAFVHRGEYLPW